MTLSMFDGLVVAAHERGEHGRRIAAKLLKPSSKAVKKLFPKEAKVWRGGQSPPSRSIDQSPLCGDRPSKSL